MPTVPRLNNRVQQAGIPNVRVSTDAPIEAFGGGQGRAQATRAVGDLIDGATNFVQEEKKKADDLLTQTAYTELVKRKNRLQWDPKDGAFTRVGQDAFSVPEEYGKRFSDEASDIESNILKNDTQRAAFRRVLEQEKREFSSQLQKHVFTESKKFDDEQTEAGLATVRDDAILNFQEPGKIAKNVELQKALIMKNAERLGKPPEWVKLKTEQAVSQTHTGVISRMLANGQDGLAKSYYENVKDSVTGQDAIALEKSLEEGSLRGESQRKTDEIVTKHTSRQSALEEARKIQDPKLRDETVKRVNDRFSEMKVAQNEASEARFQRVANTVEQTKERPDPATWANLTLTEKKAIDDRIKQLRQGIAPETSWVDYYDLKSMASSPATRNAFLSTDLLTYRPKLADPEFKDLVNLQTKMRKGDGSANKILDGFRSDDSILKDALRSAGIDPNPKKKSESQKVALFRRRVDTEVMALQERTGKKATNEDIQRIVDDMMIKGTVPGSGIFFDDEKHVFEIQPGENIKIDADDIPQTERSKIEAALKKRNLPVTEDRIVELYNRKIKGLTSGNQ